MALLHGSTLRDSFPLVAVRGAEERERSSAWPAPHHYWVSRISLPCSEALRDGAGGMPSLLGAVSQAGILSHRPLKSQHHRLLPTNPRLEPPSAMSSLPRGPVTRSTAVYGLVYRKTTDTQAPTLWPLLSSLGLRPGLMVFSKV